MAEQTFTVDEVQAAMKLAAGSVALKTISFFVGVGTVLTGCYVLGAAPERFWLLTLALFPLQFVPLVVLWRRQKFLLYFTELCWVFNIGGWMFLGFEASHFLFGYQYRVLSDFQRVLVARSFFSLANGPLAFAIIMNGNALVFHDLAKSLSLFIHLSPALVSWTMRWKRVSAPLFGVAAPDDDIAAMHENQAAESQLSFYLYFCWWSLYAVWLLSVGCKLPERGWGRSSFADAQPTVRGWGVKNTRLQALVYLFIHAVFVCVLITIAERVVYHSFEIHTGLIMVLVISATYQGAKYYNYSVSSKLPKLILEALAKSKDKLRLDDIQSQATAMLELTDSDDEDVQSKKKK